MKQPSAWHACTCSIESRLVAWQSTGDSEHLESLIAAVLPLAKHAIAQTLRRQGICDPSAIDDAVSLVLDHIGRLPGSATFGTVVTRFDASHGQHPRHADSGQAYILWLARNRAADVARERRRQLRRSVPFSLLDGTVIAEATRRAAPASGPADASDPCCEAAHRLNEVVTRLVPRQRAVIELLREGKSQVVIAHALGVCEGTVSRLRQRAIVELKRLLAE
jgi:RNA polymerase sigma factor (sigma-70 family)